MLLFAGFIFTMKAQEKPTLIYVMDPLCGWCYGFSPVMQRVYDTYKEKAHFEVITGGMITGNEIGPIGVIAPFLKKATAQVTQHTGAEFSPKFLDTILTEGTQILTSVEPSIAVQLCKTKKPDSIFSFLTALHKEIYINGLKTAKINDYSRLFREMGFDESIFINDLKNKKFLTMAQQDFRKAESLGIESYPALLIRSKAGVKVITRGYVHWNQLYFQLQQEIN
jgi:putative protein-disulfide isomerase